MSNKAFTWSGDPRPRDGQEIEVWSTIENNWLRAIYWDDGIDGLIEFYGDYDGEMTEIEEYHDLFPTWSTFDDEEEGDGQSVQV